MGGNKYALEILPLATLALLLAIVCADAPHLEERKRRESVRKVRFVRG